MGCLMVAHFFEHMTLVGRVESPVINKYECPLLLVSLPHQSLLVL